MKLKEFNTENVKHERAGTPSISVNCKAGLFSFSKAAAKLIGIKDKGQVVFLQDEDEKENWYLEVVKENGFEVRLKNSVTAGLFFNSCSLAHKVTGMATGNRRYLIAGQPTIEKERTLWGLIVRPV